MAQPAPHTCQMQTITPHQWRLCNVPAPQCPGVPNVLVLDFGNLHIFARSLRKPPLQKEQTEQGPSAPASWRSNPICFAFTSIRRSKQSSVPAWRPKFNVVFLGNWHIFARPLTKPLPKRNRGGEACQPADGGPKPVWHCPHGQRIASRHWGQRGGFAPFILNLF